MSSIRSLANKPSKNGNALVVYEQLGLRIELLNIGLVALAQRSNFRTPVLVKDFSLNTDHV